MTKPAELPKGYIRRAGGVYNDDNVLVEFYNGEWREVKDTSRSGWWRFHKHYDRNGYCDNPGRGY